MKPPIFNLLTKYVSKQRIKFTTPGHKGKIRMRTDNLCNIDIEKIPVSDSNMSLEEVIRMSETEIAGIFSASKSYYLSGGVAGGIYAVLSSVCAPGDKIIVDPECDKAVINALTFLALQVVFIKRSYCERYSINGGISTQKIERAIEKCPDAKMIILTSPTYYGVCAGIKKAALCAHENGMLLMVDESYGAHFTFSQKSPETALECGADIVIHSLSKTLGGFKGSALLHLSETIDARLSSTIKANLEIYEGDRASSAFLCAAENILFYAFKNSDKYDVLFKELERGRKIINSKTDILWFGIENGLGCDISVTDETKIVLNFSNVNMSAAEAAVMLIDKYGIECDYADSENIVFSVSLYNTASEIRKLVNSVLTVSRILKVEGKIKEFEGGLDLFDEGPNAVMSPYKAFHSGGEWATPEAAVGKICRKVISKMPQGTPIIIPGEKISKEQVDMITDLQNMGVTVHGIGDDGKIEVLSLSDSFYF
ncbi:MAG: aminotransferase class I/II-fold pyridoxal phosphate-dependent enzyme [Clostridia bacterium]|nr:aminotransferase class I/II-fold pyridoxal phosphate-dependent enzyme [Clostridia bacterium]